MNVELSLKFTKGFTPIESHEEIGYYFVSPEGAFSGVSEMVDPWDEFYKGAFSDKKETEDKTTTQTLGLNLGINYHFGRI